MTIDAKAPRVLVAGFEPFENDAVNPAWEIARALDGWACEGALVQAVQLPCLFGRAIDALDAALTGPPLQLVLCVGAAGGRTEISMERAALNIDDARIPDNAGQQPIDLPVVKHGPAAYFSTLPIKAMVRDVRAAGLPAAVSNSAGTFVCNHIFYALMHRLATRPALAHTRGGFVHVPYLPEQAASKPGVASMALAAQVEAFRVAIRTALTVRDDVRETAGRLH
ncbi:pyroglutamyl-peptidase [Variovorax boronicumulans]|uniref:Pyrrolidone-carboxylate peptidase n=1 Tax=Variovorax boronicumulans TaxID=436515 RepID=A0AAW8CZF8_9BURK|nr:pyroglutamyl-peptidase I [Variovorax boronicumulans]MDP9895899.1 pyroglutamyl-peptidase [Variovorax boronicumulans]MDQ0055939.1 pyroglutamyl-peptidase [Variovorax boronicumulans]MDQ0074751.1 pyroglutamyl-peptidase [Variovorax boronicumulans]